MHTYFLLFSHTCTAKVTSITVLGVAIRLHASWNERSKCMLSMKLIACKQNGKQAATSIHGENNDTPKNTHKKKKYREQGYEIYI